jgi:hypothetical protein
MRTVPFLNEKGEVIGSATISHDGIEADVTITTSGEVLAVLEAAAVSIGYTCTISVALPKALPCDHMHCKNAAVWRVALGSAPAKNICAAALHHYLSQRCGEQLYVERIRS